MVTNKYADTDDDDK